MTSSTAGVYKQPIYHLTIHVKGMGDLAKIETFKYEGSFIGADDGIITFRLTDGTLHLYRENILYWESRRTEAAE